MQTSELVAAIDEEIARLEQARALLSGIRAGSRHRGRPSRGFSGSAVGGTQTSKRRTISAAGRARIAAAQKARWAKVKRVAKRAAAATPAKGSTRPKKRKVVKKSSTAKGTSKKRAFSRRAPAKATATPATQAPAAEATAS